MLAQVLRIASYVFAVLAAGGAAYLCISLAGIARWLRESISLARAPQFTPAVSILKPLRGADPNMYESFRSHCQQDYAGDYELIFGVSDRSDEAVAEVERLRREFPSHRIELVVCPEAMGTNRKVSNLQRMLQQAHHDFILINDSDIHVERNYLRRVMAPFADARVGLVTAMYRAHAGRTLASRTEALTIATDFAGGVVSALLVEGGLHFAMGSTMAVRRTALEKGGGFAPLLDKLADDYELGVLIERAGYRLQLAPTVVETSLPDYGWCEMFAHQLRWARTIRDRRIGGYFGLITSFGLPWAVFCALCAPGAPWAMALLVLVGGLRLVQASSLCSLVLDDPRSRRDLWLLPLRDFAGLAVWLASWFGSTVIWRGERFRLHNGALTRLEP